MNSLRNRLALALSLVLVAMAVLLAVGLQHFPRELVERYVASRLERDAETLYVRLAEAPDAASAATDALGADYALPLSGHYFAVQRKARNATVTPEGETILSRSLWDEDLPVAAPAGAGERIVRRPGPAGQTLLAYTRRFAGSDADWTVTIAEDISPLDAAIARFQRTLLGSVLFALLVLAWLQRAIVVRGLAPLADAVEACRKLERGETASVPNVAPDEVRPMLEAINRLVHHQAQRLARVRHAAGNLSHALKTPLAVLAQIADERAAAGDAAGAETMREQVDAMHATIERELRRARLAGSGVRSEGFDARAQLEALAEALGRLHAAHARRIEVVAPDKRLALDREDMLELFGNLLDNACKWAATTVRVELREHADTLVFCVDDDGPGVDPSLLARLGQGSLRTDESRPGHGLGLTIVADIVKQYRGTIEYRRSPTLGGLRVEGSLALHDSGARSSPTARRHAAKK